MSDINFLNQLICDSRVGDMKLLERLPVDEYYMTMATWMRIGDLKKGTSPGGDDEQDGENLRNSPPKGATRKKLTPK